MKLDEKTIMEEKGHLFFFFFHFFFSFFDCTRTYIYNAMENIIIPIEFYNQQ